MKNLKSLFMLDPEVTFLNHGSFGATPRSVFEVYQQWQQQLEWQPIRFIDKELPNYLANSRQVLGNYLNAAAEDLVYVPNATFALNVVARSLDIGMDNSVLSTDHEYGACDNVWQYLSQKHGFEYIKQPISFPPESNETIVNEFWMGVTSRTKVIYLSHITSPTALRMPVEEICDRAREAGILTIVDGAHAPGQIPVNVESINPDFYFGNAHKWLCSPKGSAFLYTLKDKQHLIEPLIVGWGWGEEREITFGSDYLDYLQWLGTNDVSAYLTVPSAIKFQQKNDWPKIRQRCHALLKETLERIVELTGLDPCYPHDNCYHQMAVAELPFLRNLEAFKKQLWDGFRIEVPLIQWNDRQFIRVSIQGYNDQNDVDRLIEALRTLLPAYHH